MNDDYVKRSDVHKAFQPKYAPAINRAFAVMIDSVPAADVAEVRHGRWVVNGRKKSRFCSICYHDEPYKFADYDSDVYNYCPNCGADMRKETDSG